MSQGICIDYNMLKDKKIDFRLYGYMLGKSFYEEDKDVFIVARDLNKKDFYTREKGKEQTIILSRPALKKYLDLMKQNTSYNKIFSYQEDEDSFYFYNDLSHNPDRNFILVMSDEKFEDIQYENSEIMWRLYLYLYRKNYEFKNQFKIAIGKLAQEIGMANSTQNRQKVKKALEDLKDSEFIEYVTMLDDNATNQYKVERVWVRKVNIN